MKRLIQTQIELDSQKLETIIDVKFQNIIYYYWDGKRIVDQSQQVRIDFLGAVNEMENLDHTFEKNFIGFQNCSTGEYVQFVRLGNDSWYADVPIKDRGNWEDTCGQDMAIPNPLLAC